MSRRGRDEAPRNAGPGPRLGAEELTLLAQHRSRRQMPAPLHDEIWQRLQTSIADGEAAPTMSRTPGRPRAIWPWVVAVAAACVGALLLLRSELWMSVEDEGALPMQAPSEVLGERPSEPVQPAPSKAPATKRSRMPIGEQDVVSPSGPPQTDERPATAEERSTIPARRKKPVKAGAPKPETAAPQTADRSSLSEELALLRKAQTALAQGRTARVSALVEQHRKAFPDSMLGPERDALAVLARCSASGQPDPSAAKAARAYLEQHRGTPHAARVQRACLP